MKISIAQLNYHIGNFEGNLQKMKEAIVNAKAEGVDIICFGELATCGYPPRDFLEFADFLAKSNACIEVLKELAVDIAVVLGAPTINPVAEGKDLYNSVYFLAEGSVQHIQHKALLPTYDVFDEYRYFEPCTEFSCVSYKGKRIALTVCEDIWNIGNENPLYTVCPMDELIKEKPDFAINVSASPFAYDHAAERIDVLRANVARYGIPFFYINHVGAQTELIFDGGSLVLNAQGVVVHEFSYFKEETRTFDLLAIASVTADQVQPKEKISLIHDALVMALQNYFGKLGLKSAILGLSGGIDSAVTAVLAVRALGADQVRGLLMPSQYSSDHSVTDAVALAKNLGMRYDIIPIRPMYEAFETALSPLFEGRQEDVTEENIQARIRGILNMAVSNKYGNILLNTTNKSEMAVGYGTLYGDLCGGLSVIGDIYKMEVYALAEYINKDEEIIPLHTIQKPPSAELRPNQKDSDSLPPYEILDEILKFYIEKRLGPAEIIGLGYEAPLVHRILRLVNINEFKRYQTAPVLRVSSKAFGMGRRMPIVAKYLLS